MGQGVWCYTSHHAFYTESHGTGFSFCLASCCCEDLCLPAWGCLLKTGSPFSLSASDCKLVGPTQMVYHCKPFKRSPHSLGHWDIPNFNWEIFRGKMESPSHTGPLVGPGYVMIFWHGAVGHPPKTMGSFGLLIAGRKCRKNQSAPQLASLNCDHCTETVEDTFSMDDGRLSKLY